tara:strand:+ start:174 stop:704 length:531 start_codon:yes stop_codon:yes gene_type:complete
MDYVPHALVSHVCMLSVQGQDAEVDVEAEMRAIHIALSERMGGEALVGYEKVPYSEYYKKIGEFKMNEQAVSLFPSEAYENLGNPVQDELLPELPDKEAGNTMEEGMQARREEQIKKMEELQTYVASKHPISPRLLTMPPSPPPLLLDRLSRLPADGPIKKSPCHPPLPSPCSTPR